MQYEGFDHTQKVATDFEFDKIRRLRNRILALEELNEIDPDNLNFTKEIMQEKERTKTRIKNFWHYICNKYNLPSQNNYVISAETREILIIKCTNESI